MAVSRYSSDRRSVRRWCLAALALAVAVAAPAAGCVTVRPEDKEVLADPTMTFDDTARVQSHEDHVYNNREGSFGASGASGGGCGCN